MHQDVLAAHGEHAIFMVFGLRQGATAAVQELCSNLGAIGRSLRTRFPASEFSCVMGFGAEAWTSLFPKRPRPAELEPFQEIRGERHCAVSSPGDLLFHIRAAQMDVCIEAARLIRTALGDTVEAIDEVQGFRYLDGRAIIEFVDGTENPEGDERARFGVIGAEEPTFAGGSYVFVQKYIHDMTAWRALPLAEQEKAIGRHKFDDVELSDAEKPATAHNAVTNISDEQGNELKIVRANMSFATPSRGEYGTYFIGYASSFSTTKKMLENMFVGDPRGTTDRLLDFSTAVTGTLFFVPSVELLEALGDSEYL